MGMGRAGKSSAPMARRRSGSSLAYISARRFKNFDRVCAHGKLEAQLVDDYPGRKLDFGPAEHRPFSMRHPFSETRTTRGISGGRHRRPPETSDEGGGGKRSAPTARSRSRSAAAYLLSRASRSSPSRWWRSSSSSSSKRTWAPKRQINSHFRCRRNRVSGPVQARIPAPSAIALAAGRPPLDTSTLELRRGLSVAFV